MKISMNMNTETYLLSIFQLSYHHNMASFPLQISGLLKCLGFIISEETTRLGVRISANILSFPFFFLFFYFFIILKFFFHLLFFIIFVFHFFVKFPTGRSRLPENSVFEDMLSGKRR